MKIYKSSLSTHRSSFPVLSIAGSDCSGGAGIQADIKTISALGCYAASVITAITVQNTIGVQAIQAVAPDIVAGQIHAVIDDINPLAIKIGMVNNAETIRAIASTLHQYNDIKHIVIDPIMVSTSGKRLMYDDALNVFINELLPMATLLTPNIYEAEILSGVEIQYDKYTNEEIEEMANAVLALGCRNVLIKGGHLSGMKTDRLYGIVEREYTNENISTRNTHGTGCTLSSATASFLALGYSTEDAIQQAKNYLTQALKAGSDMQIGKGHGPVNHFFAPQKLKKR